jgi:RHS repeat-associated protein
MAQRTAGTRSHADQEAGKSRGRWIREAHVRHRDYAPTLGRFIERDPIGFEAGDNNWYRFVANRPPLHVDPKGLACGDCEPPGPGLPTETHKKVVDMLFTAGGTKPGFVDGGVTLVGDIGRLDDVLKIINLAHSLTLGSAEQLQSLIDEYTDDATDMKGLAAEKLKGLAKAWEGYAGYSVYMVVEYRSCVPCSCWTDWVGGQQQYESKVLTKYHRCEEGTGVGDNQMVGIYAGRGGVPPTRAQLERCAQAAVK